MEDMEVEEETFLANRIFDDERRTLSMANTRPTGMATNRRILMPGPRPPKEEALLDTRKALWMKESLEYIRTQCNERGDQNTQNMSPAAERGRRKIAKMVRQKVAMVMPSDKGKGVVVVEWGLYQRMGSDHTTKDEVVDGKV